MKSQTEIPLSIAPTKNAASIIDKIEELIQEKRAPFEVLRKHISDLDATIASLEANVNDYLAGPTPERFKKAHASEVELIASKSLRSRIGDLKFEVALTGVLDQSFEAAPLFTELAEANSQLLQKCRERVREFRIAAASLPESDALLELQIKIYTHQILEAEKVNTAAQRWTKEWVANVERASNWSFWPIYWSLKQPHVVLHANTNDLPVPEGFQRPPKSLASAGVMDKGRVLIPGNLPSEGIGVLSVSSTPNY